MRTKGLFEENQDLFESAKRIIVTKRARLDILPTITILTTRVSKPLEQDWTELVRMIEFWKSTKDDVPTLAMSDQVALECFVCGARQHAKSNWSTDVPQ